MRKFYTNKNLDCENLIIEDDYNHIVNVLRKKEKDTIILFNYDGFDYEFCISKINKKNIELKFVSKKEFSGTYEFKDEILWLKHGDKKYPMIYEDGCLYYHVIEKVK